MLHVENIYLQFHLHFSPFMYVKKLGQGFHHLKNYQTLIPASLIAVKTSACKGREGAKSSWILAKAMFKSKGWGLNRGGARELEVMYERYFVFIYLL